MLCGTSRTVLRNGRAITEASFDLAKLEKGWLLKQQSAWFRVVVIDDAGKHTGAILSGGTRSAKALACGTLPLICV